MSAGPSTPRPGAAPSSPVDGGRADATSPRPPKQARPFTAAADRPENPRRVRIAVAAGAVVLALSAGRPPSGPPGSAPTGRPTRPRRRPRSPRCRRWPRPACRPGRRRPASPSSPRGAAGSARTRPPARRTGGAAAGDHAAAGSEPPGSGGPARIRPPARPATPRATPSCRTTRTAPVRTVPTRRGRADGAGQSGAGQSGAGQDGAGQDENGQDNAGQNDAGQRGAGQGNPAEGNTGQGGAEQAVGAAVAPGDSAANAVPVVGPEQPSDPKSDAPAPTT